MYIHVTGKNIEITDAIKAYVKEKVGKVAEYYDQITGIDVVLSVIKNPAASGKHRGLPGTICGPQPDLLHSLSAGTGLLSAAAKHPSAE